MAFYWLAQTLIYETIAASESETSRHMSQNVNIVRRSNSVSHLVSHNSILT